MSYRALPSRTAGETVLTINSSFLRWPQAFSYPKYISSAMTKAIREQGKNYDKLAAGFEERNPGVVWTANVNDFEKVRPEGRLSLLRPARSDRQ